VGKPEGNSLLGRPRCTWEDNIRINLREIGWGGMDWIDLAQERDQRRALVNVVMNLRVSSTFWEILVASQEGLSSMEFVRWSTLPPPSGL
jgi:hypothetical protein